PRSYFCSANGIVHTFPLPIAIRQPAALREPFVAAVGTPTRDDGRSCTWACEHVGTSETRRLAVTGRHQRSVALQRRAQAGVIVTGYADPFDAGGRASEDREFAVDLLGRSQNTILLDLELEDWR